MYDITILTDCRYVNPKKTDWYIDQVLLEDKILIDALSKKNLKVTKKDWADTSFNWKETKNVIFRTTWDYFDRFEEFFSWLKQTKSKTNFINSYEIINWNIDKNYLKELEKDGVNIAPTIFLKKGEKISLGELLSISKWKEAVIKPAISGAARHTYKINTKNYTEYEIIFNQLTSNESMLFQKYLYNITDKGEISLIMIGGEYTHAVKKIAKKGDFRVQDDHGGKVEKYNASDLEIEFAHSCLKKCRYSPIYARVDIIYNNNNQPTLSELELIEPELWFRNCPESAELLASNLYDIIKG